MTPEIQTIIEEQGWSDQSVLSLLWEYVENQGDYATLLDFFRNAQMLENDEESEEPKGREFYRYVYQFEVLSEEPLGPMSLKDLEYETQEGHCSGHFLLTTEEKVGGKRMARLLQGQGSDPEFFNLDEDGNDVEDE